MKFDLQTVIGVYLPQLVLVLVVFVPLAVLAIQHEPLPDPLLDLAFVIAGFYFHAIVTRNNGNGNGS